MTQPVQEPTQGRIDSGQDWRSSQLFRRPASGTPNLAIYAIKVTGDNDGVNDPAQILTGAFYLGIPPWLDNWYVVRFWGYQSEAGNLGTDTKLRLARTVGGTVFVTSTQITIPDNAEYPSVQAVIDPTKNQVQAEVNFLRVDITDVDGAFGIGVEIILSPVNVLL